MAESVLITGGAGFIGSHLADELLGAGYSVRALDSMVAQVHGDGERPGYLNGDVELITGDIRTAAVVRGALEGIDCVVHLAARVGVGQSMYELARLHVAPTRSGRRCCSTRCSSGRSRKLVVASSMSIYGEGAVPTPTGARDAGERDRAQLERGEWEPRGPGGEELPPVADA